jgi:hypothetical protein
MLTNTVQVEGLHILQPTPSTSEQCVLDLETVNMDPPLILRAKVAWYDKTGAESPFSFQAGLQFVDLSRDQKQEVRNCIKHLKEKRS